jgi:ABC-type microcin C transport system permease subunit YejE
MYQGSFYPSSPSVNMLVGDDQNGGNNQFQFAVSLRADIKYSLVVTTYSGDVIGPFSVDVSGSDTVDFTPRV